MLLFACIKEKSEAIKSIDKLVTCDTAQVAQSTEHRNTTVKEYVNLRFRHVTLEEVVENKFRVQGQAQVFETIFNWVVGDG